MADGINVGSVEVDVVPNASRFSETVRRQVTPEATQLGNDLGRIIGSRISDQIAQGVRDGLRGAGDPGSAGAGAGDAYGGAFARTVRARIDAALRDLPNPEITVDSSEADRKIAELRARLEELRGARIGVDIDASAAQARLEEIRGQLEELGASSPDVSVRTDTAAARAELDRVRGDLDELNGRVADVTVRTHNETVNDGGSGGGGGGFGLGGILASLSPLAVPLGGAAIAGAAGLGAGVAGAAGGLAITKLGLDGVTQAATAATAAHNAAGQAASQSAAQQASAAAAVQSAEAGVANAERAAANSAVTSAQAVKAAKQGVTDAERSAAQSVQQALQQQQSAEQSLATAQYTEQQAQQNLTQARIAAKQALVDLTNSVADGALAQRQASLNVQTSKQALDAVLANPAATQLQREQAQLTYDQATQQVTDLAVRQQRLVAQQQAAAKAGVDGSTQVINAQHGVVTATQGVINARQTLARAEAAVNEARRAGAENVAKAQQAEANAVRAQQFQAAQSAAAIASAQQSLANAERQQATANNQVNTAARTAAAAMAQLTPQGQAFARFILSTLDPALKRIKDTAQAGLLPGLETGIKAAMPILPLIVNLVHSFASALGTLFTQAGKALNSPFWRQFFTYLATQAGPIITTLGRVFGDFAKIAAGLFQAFGPLALQMGTALAGLLDKVSAFATGATKNSGFQAFLAYIEKTAPVVFHAIGQIAVVIGHLIQALAPLGAVLLRVIDKFVTFLAKLSPNQLLLIVAGIGALVAVLGGPLSLVAAGVVAIAALIVNNWSKIKPVIQPIITAFHDGFVTAINAVTGAIKAHRPELTELLHGLEAVAGFVKDYVIPIIGVALKAAFDVVAFSWKADIALISLLVDAFNSIVSAGKAVGTWFAGPFVDFFTGAWSDVTNAFQSAVNWVTGAWSAVWGTVETIVTTPIRVAKDWIVGVFGAKGAIASAFSTISDWVTGTWNTVWGGVETVIVTPVRVAKDWLVSVFGPKGAIASAFSAISSWVTGTWSTIWGGIKAIFVTPISDAVSEIKGWLGAGKNGVQRIFTDAVSGIGRILKGITTAASGVWRDVENVFASGVNFVTQKILNPLVGILNDVLGVFGIKIGKIPAITVSGGGKSSSGSQLVGPTGKYALGGVLPGYSPGVDNIAIPHSLFSGGEGILVPEATRALGGAGGIQAINSMFTNRVPSPGRFAGGGIISGIGDAIGGIGGALSSVTNAIRSGAADAAISALNVAEAPIKALLGTGGTPFADKLAHGVFNKLNTAVADFIRGHASTLTAVGAQGTIPTGQHLALIRQALGLAGVPDTLGNEAAVNIIVSNESGWNPTAINLTDSNAAAGHPSQGLMQTIPGTFEAYRLGSLPDVITNPLANMVAGIRYAVSRYGSLPNVPGVRGIESGGGYVGYDSGGYLPPGVTTVFNGTGKPEPVFTGAQFDQMMNPTAGEWRLHPDDRAALVAVADRPVDLWLNHNGATKIGEVSNEWRNERRLHGDPAVR